MNKEEIEIIRKKLLDQIEKLPPEQAKQAEALKKQIQEATPEQLEVFVKQMQAQAQDQGSECFFCQIISGKIETIKIYEDANILAILDIYPANPGHLIVMPKEHFQFMYEVPDFLLNKLFIFVKTIEPILLEVTKAQSLSIYIAQGSAAGQTIEHFSINLIPRFQDDGLNFEWQKKKISKEELKKLGKEIRDRAEKIVREKLEFENKKLDEKEKARESSEAEKISRHIKQRIP